MNRGKTQRYGICVENTDYTVSLELRKIYRVLRDARADGDALVRVVDESGEDYLYPSEFFILVDLPLAATRALKRSYARQPDWR